MTGYPRTGAYHLPGWKKTPSMESKGLDNEQMENKFSGLVLLAEKKEVKELLLKLKPFESYDSNSRILGSADVHSIQETLAYIKGPGSLEGLTKDGGIYEIMNGIYSLLPYKCMGCSDVISQYDEDN